MVAAQAALRKGPALQGIHLPALLAGRRNRPLVARAQPARMLPRREGHDRRRAVPHPRPQARDAGLGNALLPGMDHDPLDPAVEHRALRRPEDRLRGREELQPLHGREDDRRAGQGPALRALQQEGRGHRTRGVQARRQARPVPGRGRIRRSGARGHALRAAPALGEARRGGCRRKLEDRHGQGLPRHRGGLRHHRGRYGHRTHRPDVRSRRRLRGARRGHPVALHDQPQGRNPPDGRPHGKILPPPDATTRRPRRPPSRSTSTSA